MIDINELRRLALDGDLAAMQEIIHRLEAAEKERDALRAALQHETDCLEAAKAKIDSLEATEEDSAHHKALAESALRVAKGWEDKCDELRAKIKAMERQEPVGRSGACSA